MIAFAWVELPPDADGALRPSVDQAPCGGSRFERRAALAAIGVVAFAGLVLGLLI